MSAIETFLTSVEKRLKLATPGKKTVERYEGFTDDTFRYEISDENCLVAFYEDNHKPLLRAKFNAELYASAHFDLEKAVKALRVLIKAAQSVLWVDECRCDEAYTGRGCHEPNTHCGELDDLRSALKEIESILGEK